MLVVTQVCYDYVHTLPNQYIDWEKITLKTCHFSRIRYCVDPCIQRTVSNESI